VLFGETIAELDGLAEGIVKKLFSGIHDALLGILIVACILRQSSAASTSQSALCPTAG
jgi:hypothetical protein